MSTHASWSSSVLPAVIVPAAVGTELAAAVRAELEGVGYSRHALLDRGSYDVIDALKAPALSQTAKLVEALVGIAAAATGRENITSVSAARALRLRPGDYLLTRHDRVYDDRPLELVLDLSPAVVGRAEVHWRHRGQVFFAMPSTPGALAIVERGPTVMTNHTYVSRRFDVSVVRLVMMLAAPPRG